MPNSIELFRAFRRARVGGGGWLSARGEGHYQRPSRQKQAEAGRPRQAGRHRMRELANAEGATKASRRAEAGRQRQAGRQAHIGRS